MNLRANAVAHENCSSVTPGPPGAGKTLLERSLPSILPNLTLDEALEITRIYSVNDMLPTHANYAGPLADSPLLRHRPFRAPHHTISHAGLVGGGRWPHPDETPLAHRGVLFLDELPGLDSRRLEVMRQPLKATSRTSLLQCIDSSAPVGIFRLLPCRQKSTESIR